MKNPPKQQRKPDQKKPPHHRHNRGRCLFVDIWCLEKPRIVAPRFRKPNERKRTQKYDGYLPGLAVNRKPGSDRQRRHLHGRYTKTVRPDSGNDSCGDQDHKGKQKYRRNTNWHMTFSIGSGGCEHGVNIAGSCLQVNFLAIRPNDRSPPWPKRLSCEPVACFFPLVDLPSFR
jgi:hypothetical protein